MKSIQFKKEIPTFLFYDYETFGVHTSLDKPCQFACIRTDINLNMIHNLECFYCFPSDDYLPDPNAVLITHITPQYTQKYGTNEYNFSKKIYNILKKPNTCIIGYNNIHFDDEITRNIFYRNFFDPYEWSWKNGNSRWDLLNVLRACYALRPHGIKWPKNTLGLTSFKLSDLTNINDIKHLNVHDATSDVYATIAMAKLIKKKQPKLFDFFLKMRKKNELYKLINLKKFKPIIYISNSFGSIRNNMSIILPIIWNKENRNILIAIDLFKDIKDIKELISLCEKVYFREILMKDLFNLGIILLYFNRCPTLAPIQTIRKEDYDRLNIHRYSYNKKIDLLKKNNFIIKNIQNIFSQKKIFNESLNVDLQIYDSFFNSCDKKTMKNIRETEPISLNKINFNFFDNRLKTLLFRYRARNFFYTLNNNEKKEWLQYCISIINPFSLKKYKKRIKDLLVEHSYNREKTILLKNLLDYVLKKYQYLLDEDANLN